MCMVGDLITAFASRSASCLCNYSLISDKLAVVSGIRLEWSSSWQQSLQQNSPRAWYLWHRAFQVGLSLPTEIPYP